MVLVASAWKHDEMGIEDPRAFQVRPAESFKDQYQAFRIVHDQYVKAGLITPQESKLRFFLRDFLPVSSLFVAHSLNRVIGTATVVRQSELGLPCSSIYEHELKRLEWGGATIAESTKFACERCPAAEARSIGNMSVVATELLRRLFYWCLAEHIHEWIIVVHPRVQEFYQQELGFREYGAEAPCPHVEWNPGVLLALNVKDVYQRRRKVPSGAEELFLHNPLTPRDVKTSFRPLDEQIAMLLLEDPFVLAESSPGERRGLLKLFPNIAPLFNAFRRNRLVMKQPVASLPFSFGVSTEKRLNPPEDFQAFHPRSFPLRATLRPLAQVLEVEADRRQVKFSCSVNDDVADNIVADPDLLAKIFVTVNRQLFAAVEPKQGRVFANVSQVTNDANEILLGLTVVGEPVQAIASASFLEPELIRDAGISFIANHNSIMVIIPVVQFDRALHLGGLGSQLVDGESGKHDELTSSPFADKIGRVLSVLIVEDNVVTQVLLRRIFSRWGHAVEVAADGEEAIRAIAAKHYDLIMLDIQLPRIDGFGVMAFVRQYDRVLRRHTPVIALTSFVMKEDRDRCMRAGVDVYLTKPLELSALIESVWNLHNRESSAEKLAQKQVA